MIHRLSVAAALALLPVVALAQCRITSLVTQNAGPSCNTGPTGCCAIVSSPTVLTASLDPIGCAVDLDVRALEGCCGVAVRARLLVLGASTAVLPVPIVGPGCVVSVQPAAFLVQTSGPSFRLQLPPTLQPFQFFAQAAAIIAPFPVAADVFTISNALSLQLQ